MEVRRLATRLIYSTIGFLTLASVLRSDVLAQHDQMHTLRPQSSGAFVKLVRESTERFRDVAVAVEEGYQLLFGCVSGDEGGAMGMHYANMALVDDDVLDPARPEIVIYEPTSNGRLRLIGADYLIYADKWHAKNPASTPELMGQLLHLFQSPNRFGLRDFYTLHVWAWKENPNGAFVNWHPRVSCEAFTPQN